MNAAILPGYAAGTPSEVPVDPKSLRALFESMLPRDVIAEAVGRLGAQKRERLLDPIELIFSLVLMGGTAESGRIASVVRDYFDRGGTRVARSSYYKWFDQQFLDVVRELSVRSLAYVAAMPKHLPGVLAGRRDWLAVDSTVVKLPDALAAVYPGTGEYAALKVHKTYSLGTENLAAYHITPARRHDGPELTIDASWRGLGLIVDLGYASFDLLRACRTHDVHVVLRLKDGWNVFVDDAAGREGWRGVPADLASDADLVVPDDEVLDVDVMLGPENARIPMRLVGLEVSGEQTLFLTNLPRTTHSAEEVGMVYRLRWCIEIDNKLSKSGCQLDEITAERPVSAEILVHASMLASMLANAIVHLDNVEQGATGAKTVKPKHPPLHPISVWKILVAGSSRLAAMLHDPQLEPARWSHVANNLTRGAGDPNWRRKPSAMDLVKGRTPSGRTWRSGPKLAVAT